MYFYQTILYNWIKQKEDILYPQISASCRFLNEKYNLNLKNPAFELFYPLLYSGVVDYRGEHRYHLTPNCIIGKRKGVNRIIVNPNHIEAMTPTNTVGLYFQKAAQNNTEPINYSFSLATILKTIPTLRDCVHSYKEKFNKDINGLKFLDNATCGLIPGEFNTNHFVDDKIVYKITHPSINPDAINIAHCYHRVINKNRNGHYDLKKKILRMYSFHLPFTIYRLLMIESLLSGIEPYVENYYYVFHNINKKSITQLNRIFCDSIKTY